MVGCAWTRRSGFPRAPGRGVSGLSGTSVRVEASREACERWLAQNLSGSSLAQGLWGHRKPGRGLSPSRVMRVSKAGTGQRLTSLGRPRAGGVGSAMLR